MQLRKVISLITLLAFIGLAFSGVMAFLSPRGPGSGQWELLGLGKHAWFGLHTNLGILFLIAGIVHIILNIKPVIAYLKDKAGRFRLFTLNFNIALLLIAWVVAGSLLDWPPFSGIEKYKERPCNRGRQPREAVQPETSPYPEKMPFLFSRRALSDICDEYGLDTDAMLFGLQDIGIDADAQWSIKIIAEENDTEPSVVFETIRQLKNR